MLQDNTHIFNEDLLDFVSQKFLKFSSGGSLTFTTLNGYAMEIRGQRFDLAEIDHFVYESEKNKLLIHHPELLKNIYE